MTSKTERFSWGSGLPGAFTAFKRLVNVFGDVPLLLCPKTSVETLLLPTGCAHPTTPDLGKNKSAKGPVDNTCEDVEKKLSMSSGTF